MVKSERLDPAKNRQTISEVVRMVEDCAKAALCPHAALEEARLAIYLNSWVCYCYVRPKASILDSGFKPGHHCYIIITCKL
jgi:hypothetical protein